MADVKTVKHLLNVASKSYLLFSKNELIHQSRSLADQALEASVCLVIGFCRWHGSQTRHRFDLVFVDDKGGIVEGTKLCLLLFSAGLQELHWHDHYRGSFS